MYFRYAYLFCRRWLWLILTGLIVGLLSGFIASRVMTPVYEGTAKVLVTRGQQGKSADTIFMDDIQLLLTNVELPTSQAVLSAASESLGYPIKARKVRVVQVGSSQVLEITVQNAAPERAADIANAIVQGMIEQNTNLMAARYSSNEISLNERIAEVQSQMDKIQQEFDTYNTEQVQSQLDTVNGEVESISAEIASLQKEIVPLLASLDLVQKQSGLMKQNQVDQLLPVLAKYQQIKANLEVMKKPSDTGEIRADSKFLLLQSTLDQYRRIYLDLVNNLETVRLNASQYTPNVVQIESAAVPERPVRPIWYFNTILAGVAGLILAVGGALLTDYARGSLNYPGEIRSQVDAPVLAVIPETRHALPEGEPLVIQQPQSNTALAVQSLITNLDFLQKGKSGKSLLISAADAGEGTTFLAVNIACSLALSGRKVCLVDAHPGDGKVHLYFGHAGQPGLTDLFRDAGLFNKVVFKSELLPGLSVIPGGTQRMENEIIPGEKLSGLITRLLKTSEWVILDGMPLEDVNTRIASSLVDGVLLVIRPHRTRRSKLEAAREQLRLSGGRVTGVIINRVPNFEREDFNLG
jgi:Mrp family chromosome partitioning ATPase/capsular polysaccharide biosynthesis protein